MTLAVPLWLIALLAWLAVFMIIAVLLLLDHITPGGPEGGCLTAIIVWIIIGVAAFMAWGWIV